MSQRSPFNERNMGKTTDGEEGSKPAGMTRRSLSKGKPARPAAEGVRIVSSKSKGKSVSSRPLTKEERKEKRRAEREEEDQVANITEMVMKQDSRYLGRRRVWWGLLIAGIICIAVSFAVTYAFGTDAKNYDLTTSVGVISTVLLVLSYAIIIAAIVWEFVKIRPIRNESMAKVRGMSAKRRRAVVEANYAAEEQRRAEKAVRKAKK